MANRAAPQRKALQRPRLLLSILALIFLGYGVWFVGERAGRNDHLQREARFLLATQQRWLHQATTNPQPELPSYTVNNGSGTVVLVNEEVTIEGHKHVARLGWTNSCLGAGTLVVTSSNMFLWREPGGATRKLNIPNLDRIPLSWYLADP